MATSTASRNPGKVWRNGKAVYTKPENLAALLIAGGASIAMHQDADGKIADYFDKHQILQGSDAETVNIIGHPTVHSAAAGIWYLLSISNKDDINIERAWTMRTALTITWLTTAALKTARDNDTPNGEYLSWPSGHVSSSFTVASVLDEFYGPKVGIPAYAVASLVAYRMMDTGDNWGSDVVLRNLRLGSRPHRRRKRQRPQNRWFRYSTLHPTNRKTSFRNRFCKTILKSNYLIICHFFCSDIHLRHKAISSSV